MKLSFLDDFDVFEVQPDFKEVLEFLDAFHA